MDFQQLDLAPLLTRGLAIVVVIVVALVVLRIGRSLIRRSVAALTARAETESQARERDEVRRRMATVETTATSVLFAAVIVVAGLMILSQAGVDVGPAIAGLGIAGLAIGFGAQQIVRDYFSGLLILVENQFGVGDVISVAGVTGTVEGFTLRRTVLRDVDGIVLNVPNGEIKVAANRTRVWRRINEDVVIAPGQDVDRAIAVLDAACAGLAADPAWAPRILEAPRVDRVERIDPSGVTLKILGTVPAADLVAVSGELRRREAAALLEAGIDTAQVPLPGSGAPHGSA
jgi:small conductance mechanosensitive channel